MRKILKIGLISVAVLALTFGLFVMTQYAMFRSSEPGFCPICHEIRFAYNTWKTSTHVNNGQGLVAECKDCHLPPMKNVVSYYYLKAYHGIREVWLHFTQETYDRQKTREIVYETSRNSYCLKCHQNLLYIPDKRGAMLAHRSVVYARPGYEKKCLDCHRNLVHQQQETYRFKQFGLPYQGSGL